MRLDKLLADSGYGSRKEVKALIKSGAVTLDGAPVTDPGAETDGRRVTACGNDVLRQERALYMMNKPQGYVTAMRDSKGRAVGELLPELYIKRNAGPVGRLDIDVTGLLIFTDDGELCHRLISPKWGAQKTYLAEVDGILSEYDAEAFKNGIVLSDFTAKPAILEITGDNSALVTVTEGKFHQVKRMFAALGKPVTALKRVAMGGVRLDSNLAEGEGRALTEAEAAALLRAVKMDSGAKEDV